METLTWGKLVECENGYHFHDSSIIHKVFGSEFYLAEPSGEQVVKDGLCLARGGRLLQKLNWNRDVAIQLSQDVIDYISRTDPNYYVFQRVANRYYENLRTATRIGWYFLLEEFMSYVCFPGRDVVGKHWIRQRLLMYLHDGIA
jgi:hypothetical protein